MLSTADEVARRRVGHALRFILPNERIRDGIYVPPAHALDGPDRRRAGDAALRRPLPPARRLRHRGLRRARRVLAQALQTYGMFLSDGGNIALTIAADRFSTAKWSSLGVTNNRSLSSLQVADFEVVDYGTETNWKADTDCIRNP